MRRKRLLQMAAGSGVSGAILGLLAIILASVALYNWTYRNPAPVVAEPEEVESSSLLSSSLGVAGSVAAHSGITLETCGCESYPEETPACTTRRTWSTSVVYNPSLDHFALTYHAHDQRSIQGEYHLVVNNPHTLSASLASVYVALEEKVTQHGDAPGDLGDHWKRISQAVVSTAELCAADTANLCSGKVAFTATSTTGSRVELNTENYNMPTTMVDNDGDNDINEDGGRSQSRDCLGSLRSQDDDFDGQVDEDGECEDTTRFKLTYALAITADQAALLANKDVRLHVLATFLTGRSADATCSTDTDCSGGISLLEKTARTVPHWIPLKFPANCPVECECAAASANVSKTGDPIAVLTEDFTPEILCEDRVDPVVATYTFECPSVTSVAQSVTLSVRTGLTIQDCPADVFGQQPTLNLQDEDSIVLNCSATV